jgi:putative MATE family efflux protein
VSTTTAPAAAALTSGPIAPALLRLALPNMLAMVAAAAVTIIETAYVGALGRDALAAMAVVFPFAMLMQMFSAGAMGGGISSAVSRALGAGDRDAAQALAWHAVLIGAAAGLFFTLLFLLGGPALYRLLGARGAVLDLAVAYSNVLFCGAASVWLANTLVSVQRGTGNMRVPSLTIVLTSLAQVVLGAGLGLGLGPFPRWGMTGVALGPVIAFSAAAVFLWRYARSPRARVPLRRTGLQREGFMAILRVGGIACLSPLQSVATVLVLTGLVARLGVEALAGYGIGARLEFLLVPIAFGVGVATVPMVGMAVGRGDVPRARRVAWTGGAISAALLGLIGLVVCLWPALWAHLFTSDAGVIAHAESYLRWAGPAYPLFGLGLTLYFASQGAGRVLGPVLAATLRLAVVVLGGWWLAAQQAPSWALFALVGVAMAVYGGATALSVWRADWRR